MVTDAVLWGLLAAGVVFIWWGCHNTRPAPKANKPEYEHTKLDRAA